MKYITSLVLLLIASVSMAQGVPNTFTAGTPALAAEVNQNFEAAAVAINGNAIDIEAAAVAINGNAMDIAALMERLDALEAQDISVFCDQGDSIQDAVDKAREGANIIVSGTCNEAVTIQGDHLHIRGNNVATIVPPAGGTAFSVISTDNILIEGFNITGGLVGVDIQQGSSARVINNRIFDSTNVGILIQDSSYGAIRGNTMDSSSGNLSQIFVSNNSSANVFDNTITASSGDGITAIFSSSVRAGRNNVSGTVRAGISVGQNAYIFLPFENTVNTIFCGITGGLQVQTEQTITGGAGAVSLNPSCDLNKPPDVMFP